MPSQTNSGGVWVFDRGQISELGLTEDVVYLVKKDSGEVIMDSGRGIQNSYGKIVAWLKRFAPPAIPKNI